MLSSVRRCIERSRADSVLDCSVTGHTMGEQRERERGVIRGEC